METGGFQCPFCAEIVDRELKGPDPVALIYIPRWTAEMQPDQPSGQFWCHGRCFINTLRPEVRGYVDVDRESEE